MAPQVPLDTAYATCPRCGFVWAELNLGPGTLYRCAGCEWQFSFGTQAPTSAINASIAVGATALPVASGGTSFTSGMVLLLDTTTNAEVVRVTATGSATSIPIAACALAHTNGATFGQLLVSGAYTGIQRPPNASPWPSLMPSTF